MRTEQLIEQTEFHDAALLAMASDGDGVRLRFGDVWTGPDERYDVDVVMGGMRKVTCDDLVMHELGMDQQDGSVIAFRRSADTAELVVNWTSYKPRADQTKCYKFEFTTFDLVVRDAGPTPRSDP
jgi:hypothetical protein